MQNIGSYLNSTKATLEKLSKTDTAHAKQHIDRLTAPFIDHLITYAINSHASDIHLEPLEKRFRIRFRVDGVLQEIISLPINLHPQMTSRLKISAALDIAQKKTPQDGRLENHMHESDIRISTCPTIFGEKVVLRLLNETSKNIPLDELGFSDKTLHKMKRQLFSSQGLILVTGPTGSGKTTTLYSMLNAINTPEKNILTLEDPVEIPLEGINQVNIHTKSGIEYEPMLRAFLRQDPDVIMIGEIRDKETADIAMKAALTGHLVLATLHTKSTFDTIERLLQMEIPSYQIASSIKCILSQRLFRQLTAEGLKGRFALYEYLEIDPTLTQMIANNEPIPSMRQYAKQQGFASLKELSETAIQLDRTTKEEIHRVLT